MGGWDSGSDTCISLDCSEHWPDSNTQQTYHGSVCKTVTKVSVTGIQILPHSYREKNILFPVTAGKNLYTFHANFGYSLTNTPMVSLVRVTVRSGQGSTQDCWQLSVQSAVLTAVRGKYRGNKKVRAAYGCPSCRRPWEALGVSEWYLLLYKFSSVCLSDIYY